MMIYPVVLLGFALAVFTLMILVVLPSFQGIFDSVQGQLPKPTRMLISVSDFFMANWWWMGLVAGAGVTGFVKWKRTPDGRMKWDQLKLSSRIFGKINQKVAAARFARTLATLQSSGIDLIESLRIAASTTSNRVVETAVEDAIERLGRGGQMTEALRASDAFPDIALAMMESGETAGRLPYMLDKTAEVYEKEVATSVTSIKSVMQPVFIAVVAIFIGAIVIALYLPMFSIYDQIK